MSKFKESQNRMRLPVGAGALAVEEEETADVPSPVAPPDQVTGEVVVVSAEVAADPVATSASDTGWLPMSVYDYRNPRPALVTPDTNLTLDEGDFPHLREAVWRRTRAFSRMTGRFEDTGFWALRNAGGLGLGFEPQGWRPVQ